MMKANVPGPLLIAITALICGIMPLKASELQKRLPGIYKLTYQGLFLSLEATKTYHPDGSYESIGKASLLGIEKALIHQGRWKLEKGDLVYTLTKSSTPKDAPVGVPLRFKVVAHDGQTLKYRDEKRNKNYSERRIGDAQ